MTGDRSGLSAETLRNLRHSNLAHLLAISGLHMGLLVALVFAALRLGLSLIPSLASGSAVKKIAALGDLIAGVGYLGLWRGRRDETRFYYGGGRLRCGHIRATRDQSSRCCINGDGHPDPTARCDHEVEILNVIRGNDGFGYDFQYDQPP